MRVNTYSLNVSCGLIRESRNSHTAAHSLIGIKIVLCVRRLNECKCHKYVCIINHSHTNYERGTEFCIPDFAELCHETEIDLYGTAFLCDECTAKRNVH